MAEFLDEVSESPPRAMSRSDFLEAHGALHGEGECAWCDGHDNLHWSTGAFVKCSDYRCACAGGIRVFEDAHRPSNIQPRVSDIPALVNRPNCESCGRHYPYFPARTFTNPRNGYAVRREARFGKSCFCDFYNL